MASRQTRQLLDLLDGFEMTKSQHDWLERRFENMTVKESLLFRGAMQIEQPRMTCDVMLIASQSQGQLYRHENRHTSHADQAPAFPQLGHHLRGAVCGT